ncbi:LysR substrate-binding domain-containing protein [Sphingomonas crocodyli]|uniref:LysR family transcriptional regulator n=1 Tax=Sphingomonas crocodyli TaxID=1979270 RepID=A0A437M761_9SPHN|nr:LysR substrate-binding domain-containing protein [Sphingomonas crocodyli]RVT93489.1 LysR family transcriptional regulator [Sphingomonas crocodyli]
MPRQIYLRQVEAFQAVVERGSVVKASEQLHITQSAMSKLISNLEADTGLQLFDRSTGRLVPTADAMRLYEEVGRIFAGVSQVGYAIDTIRREEQGRLAIGCMPAFSGSFIPRATLRFLEERPNVYCSVHSLVSPWVIDWVVTKKLDIGLVNHLIDNPFVVREPFMEHPLVCVMPIGHPLSSREVVRPEDLRDVAFVTFSEPDVGRLVREMLDAHDVRPNILLVSNVASTLCEFVAGGLGVSLVHPLALSGLEHRVTVRRFEPAISLHYQLCYSADNRNAELVRRFAAIIRNVASDILDRIQ